MNLFLNTLHFRFDFSAYQMHKETIDLNPSKESAHYDYPKQPDLKGVMKDVKVVYGNHPCDFFCQLTEESQNCTKLMEKLKAAYSSNATYIHSAILYLFYEILLLDGSKCAIIGPQIGMACVVQNDGNWCRGKIIKIKDMKVDVKLVDCGIVLLNIDKASVMEMAEEFVQLTPQAYHCTLQGVQSTWALQPNTRFKEATSDKELFASFTDRCGSKCSIILSERINGSLLTINKLFMPTASLPCGNVAKKIPQRKQVMIFP